MKNLKITTRIYLSLISFVLLIIILSFFAALSVNNIWGSTKDLYQHPYTVLKTVGDIQLNVLNIRIDMKDLVQEADKDKSQEIIKEINTLDSQSEKMFDTLYASYLGPKEDIDKSWDTYITYRLMRQETIRLLQNGETENAISRTKYNGVVGIQANLMFKNLEVIHKFAENKGNEFFNRAQTQKNQTSLYLQILIASIIVAGFLIGYILVKSIKEPLKILLAAITDFKQGKYESRSKYVSENEFGSLSFAFNSMAKSIQSRILARESEASLSNAILSEDQLKPFCSNLLKSLTTFTGAQMGAVYLLNDEKTTYEWLDSIGMNYEAKASFDAEGLEGEFGRAIATKQIQYINDADPDPRFVFNTVYDSLSAKEIMTIPILKGTEVFAVVSIASIGNMIPTAKELIEDIWKELCARMISVVAGNEVVLYSQKLEFTNTELNIQAKEVEMQRDELAEQNIELEMQKKLLDEASRMKSNFLSNMSHELRTPLNSVISLASVLNRRLIGEIPEEEYSYIDVIERNGKHLLALVNDILDLSRIEAGKEYVSPSSFGIHQLVNEVVDMIEPQAREKNILLKNDTAKDLPKIISDLSKCKHILINIISNAIKFTNQGQVVIGSEIKGNEIWVSVTDTGIGIEASKLDYIFDEFRQADETSSRQNGGTGLGLAIARKYADLISGSLDVESTFGKGSTFTLKLPLEIEKADNLSEEYFEDRLPKQQINANRKRTEGVGMKILLVEDSEPAIIQMKDILMEQGFFIEVARNGKEALEQIEKALPDAMILDLMMPDVDGFQVLGKIRSIAKTSETPVLILTAKHVSKEELAFLKGNHISQLIQKGAVSKMELLAAVERMVTENKDYHKVTRNDVNHKQTILVIEDNPDNLMTVKALLKDSYEIIEAEDGIIGIEKALNFRPSLILLDISLPNLDGFQVLDALRENIITKEIPTIALTARVMTGDREKILDYGFNDYLSKPIDEMLLKSTIRSFLDGR